MASLQLHLGDSVMTKPVPLARLDPADAWTPWKADEGNPWSLKWAGHLYRRAGFGGTWAELHQALKVGPQVTIERLLAGGSGDHDELADYAAKPFAGADPENLQSAQA